MPEQIFHGVQFRRICRQKCHLNFAVKIVEEFTNLATLMDFEAIPDYEQLLANLTVQRLQEFNALGRSNSTWKQSKVNLPPADPSNDRQLLPVETVLQDRCLPFGCPGTHHCRSLGQTRLVDEHYHASLFSGVFFNLGQTSFFHVSTASSSRWRARRAGRCGLKPIALRTRQIWGSDSVTPKCLVTTVRTRGKVQTSVGNPSAMAPACNSCPSRLRSDAPSEAGRPRGPRERSASNPPCSRRWAHPHTVERATPTRRATSACGTPFSKSRPAFNRCRSRDLSSSLLPITVSTIGYHNDRQHYIRNVHYL